MHHKCKLIASLSNFNAENLARLKNKMYLCTDRIFNSTPQKRKAYRPQGQKQKSVGCNLRTFLMALRV